MSRVGDDSGTPRALVHETILDVAASDPDASMEAIASEMIGASIDLVERVLDEYGDERGGDGAAGASIEPDLAHRAVHACMGSDRTTEAEEFRLLELFMDAGDD